MTKFRVCVQQYVEEISSIVIEAETQEAAVKIAEQMLRDGDVDGWIAGDDIINRETYAVLEETGEIYDAKQCTMRTVDVRKGRGRNRHDRRRAAKAA